MLKGNGSLSKLRTPLLLETDNICLRINIIGRDRFLMFIK